MSLVREDYLAFAENYNLEFDLVEHLAQTIIDYANLQYEADNEADFRRLDCLKDEFEMMTNYIDFELIEELKDIIEAHKLIKY